MSASLDYGIEYRPITAPIQKTGSRRYKQNRKEKILQFFCEFPNCYYCGVRLIKCNRSLDHWVPRSLGGTSRFMNLVTACRDCNGQKSNDLPAGMEAVPENLTIKWHNLKLKVREQLNAMRYITGVE